ncbi:MAG: hypothetical protein K2L89_07495, partial [Muribaculaceae bacterium]|nr:hypothetical protein [Muribaculaceae bacterium]
FGIFALESKTWLVINKDGKPKKGLEFNQFGDRWSEGGYYGLHSDYDGTSEDYGGNMSVAVDSAYDTVAIEVVEDTVVADSAW